MSLDIEAELPHRVTAKPRSPAKARLMIVEDHPIFREGLCKVLDSETDFAVCGQAASASEALTLIPRLKPDLVIVDLTLAQSSGIDLIKDLEARWAGLPVLVLSNHDETLYAERCVRAGARGYVMKNHPPQELIAAVHDALNGKYHLSGAMTNRLLSKLSLGIKTGESSPVQLLSNRELQVFEWYGKARTTGQIADLLHLSVKTVESHRDRIKEKLQFEDSASLVRAAVQWVESQNGL